MATATATRSISGEREMRGITPDLLKRLQQLQEADLANYEKAPQRTPMQRRGRYMFRLEPQIHKTVVHIVIDVPPPSLGDNPKKEDFREARWKRRVSEDMRALAVAAKEAHGSSRLQFNQLRGTGEVWFATDHEAVAKWLRAKIAQKKGVFAAMYEDMGFLTLRVTTATGDEYFPNTPQGREKAASYAAEHNGTMTVVSEDDLQAALNPIVVDEAELERLTAPTGA
jgi:hypothetical protein